MSKQTRRAQAGFSLVELMVVVAIIGILATIAVPNFQRFQAKAIQSNAKVELTAAYTAERAFYTEYNTYHANFPAIGFVPEGFTISDAATAPALQAGARRYYSITPGSTDDPVALTTLNLSNMTWNGYYAASANICASTTANSTGGAGNATPAVAQETFVIAAKGCPRRAGAADGELDVWSINEARALTNTQSGI